MGKVEWDTIKQEEKDHLEAMIVVFAIQWQISIKSDNDLVHQIVHRGKGYLKITKENYPPANMAEARASLDLWVRAFYSWVKTVHPNKGQELLNIHEAGRPLQPLKE